MDIVTNFAQILSRMPGIHLFKGEDEDEDLWGDISPVRDYSVHSRMTPRYIPPYPHNSAKKPMRRNVGKTIVSVLVSAVVLIAIAIWLVINPLMSLANLPLVDDGEIITITATPTNESLATHNVVLDNNGIKHLMRGNTLGVTIDVYQLLSSPARFSIIDVNSYNTGLTQIANDNVRSVNRSIPLQSGSNYFQQWYRSPLVEVTTIDCTIPLSQSSVTSYGLIIQYSADQQWECIEQTQK